MSYKFKYLTLEEIKNKILTVFNEKNIQTLILIKYGEDIGDIENTIKIIKGRDNYYRIFFDFKFSKFRLDYEEYTLETCCEFSIERNKLVYEILFTGISLTDILNKIISYFYNK